MKFFLDFEAEIAELEARIQELRHVNNVKGTKILDEIIEQLIFPFLNFDVTAFEYKPFTRFTLAKSFP